MYTDPPQIQLKNHQLALFHSQSLPVHLPHNPHMVDEHSFFLGNQQAANMHQQPALISTHNESMPIDIANSHVNNFMISHHQIQEHGEIEEYTKHPSPVVANQQNQANRAPSNPFELQLKHSQSLMVPHTSYGQQRQPNVEDYVNQLPIHQ